MTDKALTTITSGVPMVADAMSLADAFARSGFFSDADDQAKAIVKIQAGRELGIPPVAAMTGINIVKGKVVIGANILAGLIKRHPAYDYQIIQLDNEECDLAFFEGGQEVGHSVFTIEDARAAGVGTMTPPGKPANMLQMFTRNMLFARAVSNGMRWYCPDVTAGIPLYTPGELDQPVDEDGNMSLWATPDQREAIRDRMRELFPDVQFSNDGHYNYVLKKNGYPKLNEMTAEQAGRILENFQHEGPDPYNEPSVTITVEPVESTEPQNGTPTEMPNVSETPQRIGKDPAELIAKGKAAEQEQHKGDTTEPDFSTWRDNEWARFYSLARLNLGFEHAKHAEAALKQIFTEWETEGMPAFRDAWAMLVQHQQEAGRL